MGRAAQQTEQTMQRMDRASLQTQRAMTSLQNTANYAALSLGAMTAGLSVQKLIQYSDSWTNIESRIKLVTTSSAELASVQTQLFDIAQRNRSDMSSTVALYTRLAQSSDTLGASQKEMIRFTEGVSAAVLLSGSGTAEAAGALQQLSQAMSNVNIQAQEYNSINDGAPEILRAVARNIQGVDGDLGKLRQQMLAGKLSSKEFFAAFMKDVDSLAAKSQGMEMTVAQSFTKLDNEAMKFVGEASKASGAGQALAGTINTVANNLDTLSAAVGGLVTYKLSEWTLLITAALVQKANAAYTTSAALFAERAATVAAAEANVANTATQVAQATAKAAFIAELRAEAIVTLQRTNAVMQSAASDAASTLAMQSRAVAMAELAALGRAQIAVQNQLTAATTAAAAAQAGLTAANVTGAGAAGIARSALGLLGGPIGAVTTVLGLGAAAWLLWGNSAKDGEAKASQSIESSTDDIIANLDAQIKKLRERNGLADTGLKSIAQSGTEESNRMVQLLAQMKEASAGSGAFAGLDGAAKSEVLARLGAQYGTLYARIQTVNVEKDKLAGKTNSEKLEAWFAKNTEFLTKSEKLALEIKKAKTELGDAYNEKVEAAITAEVNKSAITAGAAESAKLAKKTLDGQLKSLEEGLSKQYDALDFGNRYTSELRQQDLIDQETYNAYRKMAFESSVAVSVKSYDEEIKLAERYRDSLKKGSEREEAQTRVDALTAKRTKAVQDAQQASAMEMLALSAAQSDLNKSMKEWGIQQDQAIAQMQFSNDLYGKSALEVTKLTNARRAQLEVEEKIRQAQKQGAISPESIARFKKEADDKAKAANGAATKGAGLGIIQSLQTPLEAENLEHANKMRDLQAYRDQELADTISANQAIERETNRHEAAKAEIRAQYSLQSLAMAGSTASQLYDLLKQSGEQQSSLAKAAFLVSKAIAVAEIIMQTNVAAAKAKGQLGIFGLPMSAIILATGYSQAAMVAGLAIAGAREKGGPVWPGGTFLVGEKGPELFTPSASGTIIPNNALGGTGKGANVTYAPVINIDSRTDQAEVHKLVVGAVQQGNADLVDKLVRAGRI